MDTRPTLVSDSTEARIREATRASVINYGLRRTTLVDIASRAGVSRQTVYRRWSSVEELLMDVLFTDLAAEITTIEIPSNDVDACSRLCEVLIAGINAIASAELVRALRQHDPEVFLKYLVERPGQSHQAIMDSLLPFLRSGAEDGSIAVANPEFTALLLTYIAQTFVISADIFHSSNPDAPWRQELYKLFHNYLQAN